MPINYKDYPPDWLKQIRPSILERAHHQCEQCGVPNHAIGARDDQGGWHSQAAVEAMSGAALAAYFSKRGGIPHLFKIVLTIAHYPDRNPMNCAPGNLLALCQRCHLNLDRPVNIRKAQHTRMLKRVARRKAELRALGQEALFELE